MSLDLYNRFNYAPTDINIERSTFDLSSTHKTTFNAGDLVPIACYDVLPGDTFKIDLSTLVRMSTPIKPVMDDCFLDVFSFFVPYRLVWDHWKNFVGENTETAWVSNVTYQVPKLYNSDADALLTEFDNWLASYIGVNGNFLAKYEDDDSKKLSISALPFRAYFLIWNEWFRDQNLQDPILVPTDDNDDDCCIGTPANADYDVTKCLKSNKMHDYFTSCVPSPQKSLSPVEIAVFNDVIVNTGSVHDVSAVGLKSNGADATFLSTQSTNGDLYNTYLDLDPAQIGGADDNIFIPTNLWAETSGLSAITVNDLRFAFATQRYFEKLSLFGSRYREVIKGLFSVSTSDKTMAIPEYIGGRRINIAMQQVVQNSSTDNTSPQGNVSGLSKTSDVTDLFTYSSEEYGLIMILATVRHKHSYQQGLPRWITRSSFLDFYQPTFAHIGYQPIYKSEIYATPQTVDTVFGYNEAWSDYRIGVDRVSGAFNMDLTATPLSAWHYADYYQSAPTLSSDWIKENDNFIARTLAVDSSLADQFLADFYFKVTATRPLPVYSVPGLIDHF